MITVRTCLPLCLVLLAVPALAVAQTKLETAPVKQAAKPAPDVIVFTNGDQLSGTLERGVGGDIVFKSEMAGELTIALVKIKELRSNGTFVVLRKDQPITRTPAKAGSVLYSDGSLKVGNLAGSPEVIPAKDAAYIIDDATYEKQIGGHAGFFAGWSGAATAGATLVRSTTYGQTFTAALNLSRIVPSVPYLPKRNRTTFDLQESYGKLTTPAIPQTVPATSSTVLTSIFHADAERDEYFTSKFYALGNVAFDHNYAQGLGLAQLYGVGVGWTPLQDAKQQLDLKIDAHFEKQTFQSTPPAATVPSQNIFGSTIAEAYKRTLPHKLVFTESASILPAFNDTNDYSANFAAGVVLPAWKKLSVSFSTTDNFLNDPAPGYQKNSYQFVTGLTYAIP